MSVFVDQTLLEIEAETSYATLAMADVTRILYWKPNGDHGYFTATVSGTKLIYQIDDGDIDQKGIWHFQAYWEIAGDKAYGSVKAKYFAMHL